MSNTIFQLKRSSIPGRTPESLQPGELGINYNDGILFYSDNNNQIKSIVTGSVNGAANSFATINVNSSLFIATSVNDILTIDSSETITLTTDTFENTISIGIKESTLAQKGVVQLYDGVDSTSLLLAATANAVFTAYELANTALHSSSSSNAQLDYGSLTSTTTTISTNSSNQVLDLFSTTSFRSVKYQIQVTSGTDYQVSEISLIHDGINSFITEYGIIYTNSILMAYDTDINSGNVRLLMTPTNNDNVINLIKTSIVT